MYKINYLQNGGGFLKSFQNAVMGAAVAENPSVMIANGWESDSNTGEWTQDFNREGLEELRQRLVEIGVMGAETLAGEALFAAAAKYVPQALLKVTQKIGPKAYRWARNLVGKTTEQINRVRKGADELWDASARPSEGLSTVKTVDNRRMFVNGEGHFWDDAGNYLGQASKGEYGGLFDEGMMSAASRSTNAPQIAGLQARNAWDLTYKAGRNVATTPWNTAEGGIGIGAATGAGTMALVGSPEEKRYGGIITYQQYMNN